MIYTIIIFERTMKKTFKKPIIKFAILAVDIVCFRLIGGKLHILLGKVNALPFYEGMLGIIGGIIGPAETSDQAVERHLSKKAGISSVYKEQLQAFSKVDRDKRGRVVSVAYFALMDKDTRDSDKASVATEWHPIEKVPSLAFDHNEIIKVAQERLKGKIGYTNIIQHLLPHEFTLTELQTAYEIILGHQLDKRNFRKKILKIGVLKQTGQRKIGEAARPAELYRFASKKVEYVEII
jgi:8-oxo-dGTP diphosphatase